MMGPSYKGPPYEPHNLGVLYILCAEAFKSISRAPCSRHSQAALLPYRRYLMVLSREEGDILYGD